MAVKRVLLPVLVQDPSVLRDRALDINAIHPVVVSDPHGFMDGPVCRRVAVVDIDATRGVLRPAARLRSHGGIYRDTGAYQVTIPLPESRRSAPWIGKQQTTSIDTLGRPDFNDPFLKVSAFGSVVRTLAFVEDPAALGRPVRWAFDGEQLLVVPRAGQLDNAFYHRDSHSLYFFSFTSATKSAGTVHCALSQDIVVHEATHAIIDGIAPDLFDASSPESLALHEAVADFTAVLSSVRNRDLPRYRARESHKAVDELVTSSRFSRIAKEFELARSGRHALRDACNRKTLDPNVHDPAQRVDPADPHALSEVLTGALFEVLRRTVRRVTTADARPRRELLRQAAGMFGVRVYTVLRMAGLIYKGLDWLPPGEVSFSDYARAMLAADEYYWPRLAQQRRWLLQECRTRHIFDRNESAEGRRPRRVLLSDGEFSALQSSGAARRRFVQAHRRLLHVPEGAKFTVRAYLGAPRISDLSTHRSSESASLGEPAHKRSFDDNPLLILKVAFRTTEPNDLGEAFGRRRALTVGTTLALDRAGAIHGLLLGGRSRSQRAGRSAFLRRLAAAGALLPPGHTIGPDGEPRQGAVLSSLRSGTLRVSGSFRALHLVDTGA
jgi:hypothetical protein